MARAWASRSFEVAATVPLIVHDDVEAAAVPTRLVEDLALIGPEDKIRAELEEWRESIATTLLVGGDAAIIRRAAQLVLS